MNENKFREKAYLVTVAASSVAGTYTTLITTDVDAEKIVGIQAMRINDSGLSYYNVGLKPLNGGVYVKDVTHVDNLVASTGVAKESRWNEVYAPAQGQQYQVVVECPSAVGAGAALTIQFLVKEKLL
jgi:hypothetical protein